MSALPPLSDIKLSTSFDGPSNLIVFIEPNKPTMLGLISQGDRI
jgi:hypothetical protein